MQITFGGSDHESIQIIVGDYLYPPTGEYYNDNWLSVRISVTVGGFQGKADACFLSAELADFLCQLQALYSALEGTAEFTTIERQLALKLRGDGKGHVVVDGKLFDQPGIGNHLSFHVQIDQTQLKDSIRDLEQLVLRFPIRG
jgi:hypothetical protein